MRITIALTGETAVQIFEIYIYLLVTIYIRVDLSEHLSEMYPRAPYWLSVNFGSGNGSIGTVMPQTIPWVNVYTVCAMKIGSVGTNFSEILIRINIFSFKRVHLKMSSAKGWPFCLGLNVLKLKFERTVDFNEHDELVYEI